jgi:protein dpy-30
MADESIAGVAEATDVPAGAEVQAMVSGEGNPPAVDGKEEAEKQEAKEYDNPELGQTAEAAALNIQGQLNLQALPIRQYLEETVVSLLVNGLTQLVKCRPEDPVEFLAAYLMKNNPKKKPIAPK